MISKHLVIAALIIAFLTISIPSIASSAEPPNVAGQSVILAELTRGQILHEKFSDVPLHIPLINKIMTAIIVIERSNIESLITISKEAAATEGPTLFLEPGEKYSALDLLYLIILRSYNDAAVALSEFVGGSTDNFVSLMNNKALQLNMGSTIFKNSTGIYDKEQYTTARELLTLMKYCVSNETFNNIFSSRTRIWSGSEGSELIINQNSMFWDYDEITGGKTDFNNNEYASSITTVKNSAQNLISIVLNSDKSLINDDSIKLLDYGFNNFKQAMLVKKNDPLNTIIIGDTSVNLVSNVNVYYTHPLGDDYVKDIIYTQFTNLTPPIGINSMIGNAQFTLKDGTVIDIGLFPDRDIPLPQNIFRIVKQKLMEHSNLLYLLIFLAVLEFMLILSKAFNLLKKS